MKYVPVSLSRFAGRSLLKANAASPTILVVAGVVGLGATAVMAAKATRKIDPVLDKHKKDRVLISNTLYTNNRERQQALLHLYTGTATNLTKIYGPTLAVGSISAASVLCGHKILRGRHIATMAAYSGLAEEFRSYRRRVAQTWGEEAEKDIHNGAHGEWEEDPDHKGEYKLKPKFGEIPESYLRPFFDEVNPNFTKDPVANYLFLKGVQAHMNHRLEAFGHVFLNDVYDALGMPRCREGAVAGWLHKPNDPNHKGDNFVDFGFMSSRDPQAIAFRNGEERAVRLNFNIDPDVIFDQI
jgi:hypothetical protein